MTEFYIDTAYEANGETWILGRTGEATSLSIGDVFNLASYYLPRTKFEEYIEPPILKLMGSIEIKIIEIESYEKKIETLPRNTIGLLKIEWDGKLSFLQSECNVLIVEHDA